MVKNKFSLKYKKYKIIYIFSLFWFVFIFKVSAVRIDDIEYDPSFTKPTTLTLTINCEGEDKGKFTKLESGTYKIEDKNGGILLVTLWKIYQELFEQDLKSKNLTKQELLSEKIQYNEETTIILKKALTPFMDRTYDSLYEKNGGYNDAIHEVDKLGYDLQDGKSELSYEELKKIGAYFHSQLKRDTDDPYLKFYSYKVWNKLNPNENLINPVKILNLEKDPYAFRLWQFGFEDNCLEDLEKKPCGHGKCASPIYNPVTFTGKFADLLGKLSGQLKTGNNILKETNQN